jgi:hypothetical protein
MKRTPSGIPWIVGTVVWLVVVLGGFAQLQTYKATAGSPGQPPQTWPPGSVVTHDAGRPVLIMFAHPHCPCTRASVSELARLLSRHPELDARVLFLRPEGFEEDWERTDLWRTVAEMPRAHSVRDDNGREAARFGATTSGQVLLFDKAGRLQFSGGLTASRGHEGESLGQRRITELLTTGTTDRRDSPVFGCSLVDGHSTRP